MKKYQLVCFLFFFYGVKAFTQTVVREQTVQNDFKNYANTESSRNYSGSYLTTFKNTEGTLGSPYLFDKWVSGKVIDKKDSVINTAGYFFNYDKIAGKILVTKDKKTIIEVEDSAIKSFSFFDPSEKEITFKKINNIEKNRFLIVLVEKQGASYSLYKFLKTKFVKANYTTNGLIQSGNKYDEYVDEYEYYIGYSDLKTFTKVELKEKAIKKALPNNEEKVKSFFEMHKADKMNESLLVELISYLN
jgi:hypothetical protein